MNWPEELTVRFEGMWNEKCGIRNEGLGSANQFHIPHSKFHIEDVEDVEECEMRNMQFEMKDWGVQTNFTFLISNSTLKL